jgi:hypothetical protein
VLKHHTLKRTARSHTASLEGSSSCAALVLCVQRLANLASPTCRDRLLLSSWPSCCCCAPLSPPPVPQAGQNGAVAAEVLCELRERKDVDTQKQHERVATEGCQR